MPQLPRFNHSDQISIDRATQLSNSRKQSVFLVVLVTFAKQVPNIVCAVLSACQQHTIELDGTHYVSISMPLQQEITMCSANIRHFFSPSKNLQMTGMTNVWHLFVETFQSAIFSGRDVSGTKKNTRSDRGTKCGCSERYCNALFIAVRHVEVVLITAQIIYKCFLLLLSIFAFL